MQERLLPLDKWNDWVLKSQHVTAHYPKANGIACPKCSREMEDVNGESLFCQPPKMLIRCPECRHLDHRLI